LNGGRGIREKGQKTIDSNKSFNSEKGRNRNKKGGFPPRKSPREKKFQPLKKPKEKYITSRREMKEGWTQGKLLSYGLKDHLEKTSNQ